MRRERCSEVVVCSLDRDPNIRRVGTNITARAGEEEGTTERIVFEVTSAGSAATNISRGMKGHGQCARVE